MEFELSTVVDRLPAGVFAFLEHMENHPQETGSQVLSVEQLTPGPVAIGTRFREIVQMLPLVRVEMMTEVTRHRPDECLEFTWRGGGMEGVLTYELEPHNGATRIRLHETVTPLGPMRLAGAFVRRSFQEMLAKRLDGIKQVLEPAG
jgi:hypothetical protein